MNRDKKAKEILIYALVAAGILLINTRDVKADFVFGTPMNLGQPINSSADDGSMTMSPDGLELYFDSSRDGWNLWVTKRATVSGPWGEAERLWFTTTETIDFGPNLSADGLELYYSSNRGGAFHMWVTKRATILDSWAEPVNLGNTVNGPYDGLGPHISADGLELFFGSNRPGGSGGTDIWVTKRKTIDDPWGDPVNLGANVNSSAHDNSPVVSADGLLLFFESIRPGGYGDYDIWMSRRATINDSWGPAQNLGPPINTSLTEYLPGISSDGRLFEFNIVNHSDGLGGYDIWQAPVMPIVDLNSDGIVNADDMCIIVDNWGTDNSLCDIGPMPWGDGIVDVQDLIVLAEHLFEEFPPIE